MVLSKLGDHYWQFEDETCESIFELIATKASSSRPDRTGQRAQESTLSNTFLF